MAKMIWRRGEYGSHGVVEMIAQNDLWITYANRFHYEGIARRPDGKAIKFPYKRLRPKIILWLKSMAA